MHVTEARSLRIRLLVSGATLAFVIGCGQGFTPEQVDASRQPVLGNQESTSAQNAVVQIFSPNRWDTGFLVAPTLVLTARSAVSEASEGTPAYWRCDSDAPVSPALAASRLTILVGVAAGPKARTRHVKRTFVGPGLDFCNDPLALLELEEPINDVAPMQLRLDTQATIGETGTLIGWGESTVSPQANSGLRRFQTTLDIRSVSGSTFITGPGGCYGDSGAPFVSAQTGAVAGVMIRFNPGDGARDADSADQHFSDCADASTVFQSLFSQRDWLRRAFAESHQAPWLEGAQSRPAVLGETCAGDSDCISGFCATAGSARFCSDFCDLNACPTGMQCLGAAGMKLCVPEEVPSEPASSASCEVAWGGEKSSDWPRLAALTLVIHQLRRRRTLLRSRKPNPQTRNSP